MESSKASSKFEPYQKSLENTNNNNISQILPEGSNKYDLSFKLIILGNSGVGKSCLTIKGMKNIFIKESNPTIGFEFFNFTVRVENKIVKLQIWDTCGQEVFRSLVMNFYRNSSLAILVYAIDDKFSFESLNSWLSEIKTHIDPNIKRILVGNKNDLKERQVSKEEGLRFKEENNFDLFFETSAKNDEEGSVSELFIEAARLLVSDNQYLYQESNSENNKNIRNQRRYTGYTNERLPSKSSFILSNKDTNRFDSKSCSC